MGLPPVVWLELVLLLAALLVGIFGGAWVLRWLFSRRRADTDEVGDNGPAIKKITLEVTTPEGGSVSARWISDDAIDHRGAPATPPPSATLAELRDAVDAAIVVWYRAKLAPEALVVDYAMYLWNEGEMPKELAEQIGTGLAATAESLDALPPAVQVAIATRWPSLARDVPGMLTWQRTLTDGGFGPYR